MKKDMAEQFEKWERRPVARPEWNWPLDTINLIQTDPMGMYTGIPADPADPPVQDADDL